MSLGPDADQVWQNMRAVYAGFLAGDAEAVDALLDPAVTLWDSSEVELVRGLDGLREMRSRRPVRPTGPSVVDLVATDPVIDVWGDLALLRHRLRVVLGDRSPDQLIRNTSVWRRTPTGWRAVHNHEDVVSNGG